jgi:hypothetical protein
MKLFVNANHILILIVSAVGVVMDRHWLNTFGIAARVGIAVFVDLTIGVDARLAKLSKAVNIRLSANSYRSFSG